MASLIMPKKGLSNENFVQVIPEVAEEEFCENILEVNLSGNNIENTVILDFFPNLLTVDLSKNTLKKIKKIPKRLQILNFSFNRIETLIEKTNLTENGSVFRNLKYLKHLDLSNNEISILPEKVFQNCTSLQVLNLKGNKIRRVKNALGLISLETYFLLRFYCLKQNLKISLNLSNNKIEDPSDFALLSESPNLKYIFVNHNPFSEKQKLKQVLLNFKTILPTLIEVDESSIKQLPEKKKPSKIPKEEPLSKQKNPTIFLKLGEIYGKMAEYHPEEVRLNSARNHHLEKDTEDENLPNILRQRRRSLSFASNGKKNYPSSARNYEERRHESNLSQIREINESEEFYERPRQLVYDFKFNEEIITIQNKLIKEKNDEIYYWKNKYNMIAQKKTEAKKGGKINRTQSKRDLA